MTKAGKRLLKTKDQIRIAREAVPIVKGHRIKKFTGKGKALQHDLYNEQTAEKRRKLIEQMKQKNTEGSAE